MSPAVKALTKLFDVMAMPTEGFTIHLSVHIAGNADFEALAAMFPTAERLVREVGDGRFYDVLRLWRLDIFGPNRNTRSQLALVPSEKSETNSA